MLVKLILLLIIFAIVLTVCSFLKNRFTRRNWKWILGSYSGM